MKLLDNRFFMTNGIWSKTAFIAITTWALVIFKYIAAGLSLSYAKAAAVVAGVSVPSAVITYAPAFDMSGSIALLTLVFGLYFGNKFTPERDGKSADDADRRKDIRQDAADDRKDIREDAVQDRKDIREGK